MWLRAEADNRAFYPDECGHFNLQEASLLFGAVLSVEGPYLPPASSPSLTVSSSAQASGNGALYNSTPPAPAFRSVIPKHSSSKGPSVSVKIIRATMESSRTGKTEFFQEAQMHIDITESTANVDYVTKEVQQRWGQNYVVVTGDGLQLEDCEGTQGT